MNKLKSVAAFLLAAFFIITQQGCADKTVEPVNRQSFFFDTICSITVYDMDEMSEEKASDAISEAFDLCGHYESLLSRTQEGTDIYRINNAGGDPVECDPETIDVIKKGLYYSELSGGAFDITIGRVSDLWDFHAQEPKLPDEKELAAAVRTVDWSKVHIDGCTVTLENPETHIDLGGIAKGYIGDRISEKLRESGVTSAVVSLGGNIVCIGGKGSGESRTPFKVGIEKPYSGQMEVLGVVGAEDETVVTSGVYQRYFDIDGVRYHHILDARTGFPAESDIAGVTLKAADGRSADCDALATIYLIMGEEKAMAAVKETEGMEAFFVLTDGSCAYTDGMGVEME